MDSEKVARETIQTCFWCGLVLGAVGAVFAIGTWPGFSGPTETGVAVGWLLGLAVAWFGSMVMLVGIVGFGVQLGREASPLASSRAIRDDHPA